MTLNEMVTRAHSTAVTTGWWDGCAHPGGGLSEDAVADGVPLRLALIHLEISKALEICRGPSIDLEPVMSIDLKPTGFVAKLADAVIRIGDLAGALGIDLEAAVRAKMTYNETRPYKHGGKRF